MLWTSGKWSLAWTSASSLPWKPQRALSVEAEEVTDGHDEQELMWQSGWWPDALVQGWATPGRRCAWCQTNTHELSLDWDAISAGPSDTLQPDQLGQLVCPTPTPGTQGDVCRLLGCHNLGAGSKGCCWILHCMQDTPHSSRGWPSPEVIVSRLRNTGFLKQIFLIRSSYKKALSLSFQKYVFLKIKIS